MEINLKPGNYILAISGGVDSMVLLDVIIKQYLKNSQYRFIVAHVDHGIRVDSIEDRNLVELTAEKNGLDFRFIELNLGSKTSEAVARQQRYDFLYKLLLESQSDAVLTAHHQNDVLETAIFNLMRGTGRKGLTSLKNQPLVLRPLINYSKYEILEYAKANNISWREDSTNSDLKYARNLIRKTLMPKLSESNKLELTRIIRSQLKVNDELDILIDDFLDQITDDNLINKKILNELPQNMASEIIASWLRRNEITDFDKKTIERILKGSKIGSTSSKYDVKHNAYILVQKDYLALRYRER